MMAVFKWSWVLLAIPWPLYSGQIEGRVTLSPQVVASAVMISPYSRNRYSPPVTRDNVNDVSNVIIYIKSHSNLAPSDRFGEPALVDQQNITILPHVTVTEVGSYVKFLNSDAVYHNIFSLSKNGPFNLGRFPNGQSRQITFNKIGVVEFFCDIHSDMSGVIVVVPNAFYATPDADGRYKITGLPKGTSTVAAWRENAPEQPRPVTIAMPGEPVIVNFNL